MDNNHARTKNDDGRSHVRPRRFDDLEYTFSAYDEKGVAHSFFRTADGSGSSRVDWKPEGSRIRVLHLSESKNGGATLKMDQVWAPLALSQDDLYLLRGGYIEFTRTCKVIRSDYAPSKDESSRAGFMIVGGQTIPVEEVSKYCEGL